MHLNTELGFVIDSPVLAQRVHQAFDTRIPINAYEVRLDDDDRLYWVEQLGEQQLRHDREPNTGWLKRIGIWLLWARSIGPDTSRS